jgi:hypothetical protein
MKVSVIIGGKAGGINAGAGGVGGGGHVLVPWLLKVSEAERLA